MNNKSSSNIRQSKRRKTQPSKEVINHSVNSDKRLSTTTSINSKNNKSYYCSNCKSDFLFSTVQKFIKFHALQDNKCKSYLFQCGPQCEKNGFIQRLI